jgi:mannose-6-phosphate isomerase-like protein (cupin superfamily)
VAGKQTVQLLGVDTSAHNLKLQMNDDRNFFEVLLPKLKQAAEQFDMVPCPQHKPFGPQDWRTEDSRLPGNAEAYFLKNATGPAYELGGTVCRPLTTTAESSGKFAIGSIEASSQYHDFSIFARDGQQVRFEGVHHALQVVSGSFLVRLESLTPKSLQAGDVIYIPKGTAFSWQATSRYSKLYAFVANGGGIVEVLQALGKDHNSPILPEKADTASTNALKELQTRFGFSL